MRLSRHRRQGARLAGSALATALLATPAAAHGTGSPGGEFSVALPLVVAASVVASLAGGGLVLAAFGRRRFRGLVPLLFLALGGLSVVMAADGVLAGAGLGLVAGGGAVALVRGRTLTDCGGRADAALGVVTLHRGLEGVVLATVYAADAALGLVGAGVLAVHAAAETAAVGSLYAPNRHLAVGAVALLQVGFILGVATGWFVVDSVPPVVQSGLLALVGAVLLAVGGRETYQHLVKPSGPVTAGQ